MVAHGAVGRGGRTHKASASHCVIAVLFRVAERNDHVRGKERQKQSPKHLTQRPQRKTLHCNQCYRSTGVCQYFKLNGAAVVAVHGGTNLEVREEPSAPHCAIAVHFVAEELASSTVWQQPHQRERRAKKGNLDTRRTRKSHRSNKKLHQFAKISD